jgi:hypothetical protein
MALQPSAVDNARSWSVDSRPQRRRWRLKSRSRSREPTWRSRSRELGAFLEDKEEEGSWKLVARLSPSTLGRPVLLRTLKTGVRPVAPPDTEVWVSTCA